MGVVIFWSIILGFLSQSQLAKDIDNKVTLSSYFRFKNYVGQNQNIDSRIKVFAFDDRSVFRMGRPSLTMLEWINVIKKIDTRKPKMIVFDLMFSILNIPDVEYEETLKALEELKDVNAKLVTGSYSTKQKSRIRQSVDLQNTDFDPRTYLKLPADKDKLNLKNFETVSYDKNDKYILGPDSRLLRYLDHIGNIEYDKSGGAVFFPFTKVADDYVLPHLMMYAADSVEFYRGNIYVNRKLMPVKKDNTSYVNYASPMTYYKKIRPMINLLNPKRSDKYLKSIKEGDIVYFMPEYYTGGTDFKATPIGLLPGGIVNLAVLDSILTNNWLRPSKFPLFYLILGATLGAVVALNSAPLSFFISLTGILFLWGGFCLYLFSFHNIVMPLVSSSCIFSKYDSYICRKGSRGKP